MSSYCRIQALQFLNETIVYLTLLYLKYRQYPVKEFKTTTAAVHPIFDNVSVGTVFISTESAGTVVVALDVLET